MLGLAPVLTSQAIFPDTFWRIVEENDNFEFKYGNESNPARIFHINSAGQVGLGGLNGNTSVLMELSSSDKAILFPRVTNVGVISDPQKGMMVYDITESCFRVYQGDHYADTGEGWSLCTDMTDGVQIDTNNPAGGAAGSVYFNIDQDVFYVHDGGDWRVLSADIVVLGDEEPDNTTAQEGDLFFNRATNQFFIFDGTQYVNAIVDFEILTSSQKGCRMVPIQENELEAGCSDGEFIGSLVLEPNVWTGVDDLLNPAEVSHIECCAMAFGEYWWHTTPWSECRDGRQTRTIRCHGPEGELSDSEQLLCNANDRPVTGQDCREGGECSQQNLVENGGFESGNTGFSSGYTFQP